MKITEELISSRQNRTVVEIVKLSEKKARDSMGLFRFDGFKLLFEAVEKGISIEKILVAKSKADCLKDINTESKSLENTTVYAVEDSLFEKISEEQAPQGVISVARFPHNHIKNADEKELLALDKKGNIIMLESLRDPGNMGSVMRSAAAFGIKTVIVSRDCADIYNPKTVRGAMGALFKLDILTVNNICSAVEVLKKSGRNVYAAALDKNAVGLDEVSFCIGDAVIIGNEGHGLSPEVMKASSKSLYIPMEDGSESLNAAVAASVILWSMYKK